MIIQKQYRKTILTGLFNLGILFIFINTATMKQADKKVYDNFIDLVNTRLKATLFPKKPFFQKGYEKELAQWGTKEGIIDVADDLAVKKDRKKQLADIEKAGAALVKVQLAIAIKGAAPTKEKRFFDFKNKLDHDYIRTQITVENISVNEKLIRLFGGNKGPDVSPPMPGDVEEHIVITSVPVDIHPQGIKYNPVTGMLFCANQISGTVSVLDANNNLVQTIQLVPSLPGLYAPVAFACNSFNGKTYVAGAVSDLVAVINAGLNVTNYIPVGPRPEGLDFNKTNNLIYVPSLVNNNVVTIDANTETVVGIPLPVGASPIAVKVNPLNGDIFIVNSAGNSVSVYDNTNTLITTIAGVGNNPVAIGFNFSNQDMYVVSKGSSELIRINTTTYSITGTVPTGPAPSGITFNLSNSFLYVLNGNNTITIVRPDDSIRATIVVGSHNIGIDYHAGNGEVYVSDTLNDTINVIGFLATSNSIIVNSDYDETNIEFIHNPIILKHARFVFNNQNRIKTLQVKNETPTGKKITKTYSFNNYLSPQNFLNVSEVMDLQGLVIDGKTSWEFLLPGLTKLTLLIWYKQFNRVNILFSEKQNRWNSKRYSVNGNQ